MFKNHIFDNLLESQVTENAIEQKLSSNSDKEGFAEDFVLFMQEAKKRLADKYADFEENLTSDFLKNENLKLLELCFKVNPELVNKNLKKANGETPLIYAIFFSNLKMLLLLAKYNVQVNLTNNGLTPLHLACQMRNPEVVSAVIEIINRGNDKNKIKDIFEQRMDKGYLPLTAFEIACSKGDLEIVILFSYDNEESIKLSDPQTALDSLSNLVTGLNQKLTSASLDNRIKIMQKVIRRIITSMPDNCINTNIAVTFEVLIELQKHPQNTDTYTDYLDRLVKVCDYKSFSEQEENLIAWTCQQTHLNKSYVMYLIYNRMPSKLAENFQNASKETIAELNRLLGNADMERIEIASTLSFLNFHLPPSNLTPEEDLILWLKSNVKLNIDYITKIVLEKDLQTLSIIGFAFDDDTRSIFEYKLNAVILKMSATLEEKKENAPPPSDPIDIFIDWLKKFTSNMQPAHIKSMIHSGEVVILEALFDDDQTNLAKFRQLLNAARNSIDIPGPSTPRKPPTLDPQKNLFMQ